MTQSNESLTRALYDEYHRIDPIYEPGLFKSRMRRIYPFAKKDMKDHSDYKEYYNRMKAAIMEELKTTGSCWLLESMMVQNILYILDYAAFRTCYEEVINGRSKDFFNDAIPYTNKTFFAIQNNPEQDINPGRDFTSQCMALLSRGSQLQTEYKLDQLRKQQQELQQELNTTREQLTEANFRLQSQQEQIDAMAGKAIDDARERLKAEAEAAAETIRKSARDDAAQLLCDAQTSADQIRQEAEDMRSKAQKALSEAEATVTARMEQAEQDVRSRMNAARRLLAEECTQGIDQHVYHDERRGIEDRINGLQADVITSVGEQVGRLEAAMASFRGTLASELSTWKISLFKKDYSSLASFFIRFYRYSCNLLDKKIREQRAEDSMNGGDSAAARQLIDVQTRLQSFLVSLERAMKEIGLEIIRPAAGDEFDDTMHTTEDNDDATGQFIQSCTCPGVKLAEEYGAVLVRAEVTLARAEDVPARPAL